MIFVFVYVSFRVYDVLKPFKFVTKIEISKLLRHSRGIVCNLINTRPGTGIDEQVGAISRMYTSFPGFVFPSKKITRRTVRSRNIPPPLPLFPPEGMCVIITRSSRSIGYRRVSFIFIALIRSRRADYLNSAKSK